MAEVRFALILALTVLPIAIGEPREFTNIELHEMIQKQSRVNEQQSKMLEEQSKMLEEQSKMLEDQSKMLQDLSNQNQKMNLVSRC